MPIDRAKTAEIIRELGDLGRELSTRTILFHQSVAENLGLNVTDHKCLDFVLRAGEEEITAGRLSELTGLTTGAVTGVLDRLERAGFIQREKDPRDRRQIVIRALPERLPELEAIFEPFERPGVSCAASTAPSSSSSFAST
ncbi:MAG: MarR family transcriptional regulator [Polyangiaceae bacterium]